MTVQPIRRPRSVPAPALVVGALVALAIGARLVGVGAPDPAGLDEPLLAAPPPAEVVPADPAAPIDGPAPAVTVPAAVVPDEELADIRTDIDFWAARLEAQPGDIVAAVRLADMRIAEARTTGDVTAYVAAGAAADAALAVQPRYAPAQAVKASVLVALHQFGEARDLALAVLDRSPGDPGALGVLGDARLELGDLAGARSAYQALTAEADGSAARLRNGRLAFVTGDPSAAIAETRSAVAAAQQEGLEGSALAFTHGTLGELLRATGDESGARSSFEAALDVRTGHPAALVGLARLDAFEGDLDTAIGRMDDAVAAIPNPDWLALRADLLTRRGTTGDAEAAAADEGTIEAVAILAGEAAGVYDRGLALHLADTGLDPARAVRLAEAELAARPDVYGYDTLAWALVAAGRASEATTPMAAALAAGTRDAKLWYHAGVVAAATGDSASARVYLTDALALGAALDPVARAGAEAALVALP